MDAQSQRSGLELSGARAGASQGKLRPSLAEAGRFLPALLLGLSVGLLVTLLFWLCTALHLNHENMIFDAYNTLIWAGSLTLGALVALIIFRP